MSLINDLLINLEERRGGHLDKQAVFAGLSPAVEHEQVENSTTNWWKLFIIIILIAAILLSGLWLHSKPAISMSGSDNHMPDTQLSKPAKNTESNVVVETTRPGPVIHTSIGSMLNEVSLKFDDVINLAATEVNTVDTVGASLEVNESSLPAVTKNESETPVNPVLKAVHISGQDHRLQLKLELDGIPVYQSFMLSKPDRLVVELEKADYAISKLDWKSSPDIKNIRTGQHGDQLRIVFDLDKSFELVDSNLLQDEGSSLLLLSLVDPASKSSEQVAANVESYNEQAEPEVVRNQHMEVRPRNVSTQTVTDTDDYQNGLRLYQQRRFNESAAALRKVVEHEPTHARAQYFLASALLYAGQLKEAEEQLHSALLSLGNNTELKRLYAHILMDQGKSLEALAILADSPPAINSDVEYHALLAALMQEQQMHIEAADIYRNLLQLRPANGVWWMGLGISLEALSLRKEALGAYKQALEIGTLPANLTQYVNNRIQTLGQDQS